MVPETSSKLVLALGGWPRRSITALAGHGVLGSRLIGDAQVSQAEDMKEITDLASEWRRSAERGDLDAHISFLAEDAIVLYPGGGAMEPAAVRVYEEVLRRYHVFTSENLNLQAPVISGDFAYIWGEADTVVTGVEDPSRKRRIRTYLLIWHRQSSGEWKLKVAMYNESARRTWIPTRR